MDDEEKNIKLDFILSNIGSQIDWFSDKRKVNRTKSLNFNLAISLISIVLLIILGLDYSINNKLLSISAIFLSLIVAILSSIKSFFKYKETWILYTMTINELLKLKEDINFHTTGKKHAQINQYEVLKYYERYNHILGENNQNWKILRSI